MNPLEIPCGSVCTACADVAASCAASFALPFKSVAAPCASFSASAAATFSLLLLYFSS